MQGGWMAISRNGACRDRVPEAQSSYVLKSFHFIGQGVNLPVILLLQQVLGELGGRPTISHLQY